MKLIIFTFLFICLTFSTEIAESKELESGAPQCVLCELVVEKLTEAIGQNNTQQNIKNALSKVCNILPRLIRSQCNSFVQNNAATLIQALVDRLQPHQVCVRLRMCSNLAALPPLEKLDGDTTCVLCEFVIKELQDIIGKNNTQQNIINALNKVCNILPRVIRTQCTSFVQNNAQALINVLIDKLQPHQACVRLRMCDNLFAVEPIDVVEKLGDTTCVLCEFIVKELEDMIGNNNTQQNIINALNKVCNILPRLVRSTCTNLVQNNAQTLIQILIQRLQPHTACVRLRMCSSMSKPYVFPCPKKVGDNNLCPMCQLFVTLVENYLSQNSTIDFIKVILHNFPCQAFFSGNLEKQCEDFVDNYVSQLIDWVKQNEPPQVFCSQVGLC